MRKRIPYITAALLCATALLLACSGKKNSHYSFEALSSDSTGIQFANQLTPTPAFNLFSYMYYYNGAGVGAGDVNNDGLIDLFFAANQKPNALYLNKGNMRFEDVSRQANIPLDSAWSTGVSMVDINADGMLDIYVCRVSNYKVLKGQNQLLICEGINKQGIPQYKDEAERYGLAFAGFSTQAAFADYDLDGDLDMFLLNHSVNHDGNYAPREQFINTFDSLAGQRLYRNDSKKNAGGILEPIFTNVTAKAGINGSRIGYGLGVTIADINIDGWPDIYVGNDFHENDYLYINQKNGSFREEGTERLRHTSQFSMGVDVADINNDAFPEIISMDMLPDDPVMLRRSLSEDDYNIFQHKLAYGYSYQYARNNLQLNLRNGKFSEIGQQAGVYATDWSWAALFMDFDNDGRKDLFVSNGIPKRMNDIDYINFVSGEELQQKLRSNGIQDKDLALINKFPEIKLPNQFFRNSGELQFSNLEDSIGNNVPTFSNGALYADLDNDGDLDIVVNNINDKAFVYRNNTNSAKSTSPFVSIRLKGPDANPFAVGTKVVVYANKEVSTYESQPVHGFLSSMQIPLHVGLMQMQVDSAFIIWPDNSYQRINWTAGKINDYTWQAGLPPFDYNQLQHRLANSSMLAMKDITDETGLQYRHIENQFNEFDREALIPHMISTEGPALAIADINGDGLEDLFTGGSKSNTAAVFLQMPNGKFSKTVQPALQADSMWEHVDAQWADLNNDKYPDLVIATGGNEYYGNDEHLKPLLYLNDGKGMLTKKNDAFGEVYVTQSKVLVHDFNGDGIPDLFVAGRAIPWQYGIAPRSYLLQNDGTGRFADVTEKYCKELLKPGMVTDAVITDINQDKQQDILLCYEWAGADAFIKNGNQFKKQSITNHAGWWQTMLPVDVDKDGDIDIVAGNYGLNHRLKASEKAPVKLYVNDFDDNGRTEQVMTYYLKGKQIPFSSKLQLEKQMPYLKKKYLYAEDFSKATVEEMFGKEKLSKSMKWEANDFANTIFLNDGKGKFTATAMPPLAQVSTIRSIVQVNANNDALPDFLLMGNFTAYHVELGRQDANYGTVLVNKGNGRFAAETLGSELVPGEVRRMQLLNIGQQKVLVMARNNQPLLVCSLQ